MININLNQSVTLSFCLPQKAHQFHKKGFVIEPEAIDKCLQALKPYHGMLLLVDPSELFDCVPPSGAKMVLQLIEVYNPLKSLQNMASDADLSIEHVIFENKLPLNLYLTSIFFLGLSNCWTFSILGKSYNNISVMRDKCVCDSTGRSLTY